MKSNDYESVSWNWTRYLNISMVKWSTIYSHFYRTTPVPSSATSFSPFHRSPLTRWPHAWSQSLTKTAEVTLTSRNSSLVSVHSVRRVIRKKNCGSLLRCMILIATDTLAMASCLLSWRWWLEAIWKISNYNRWATNIAGLILLLSGTNDCFVNRSLTKQLWRPIMILTVRLVLRNLRRWWRTRMFRTAWPSVGFISKCSKRCWHGVDQFWADNKGRSWWKKWRYERVFVSGMMILGMQAHRAKFLIHPSW